MTISDEQESATDARPSEDRAHQRRRAAETSKGTILLHAERFGLLGMFGVVIVLFSILRPNTFPTSSNWTTIAVSQSVTAVGALALLMPLITGRFDVSVGANIGICAIATAALMSKAHLALSIAIIGGIGLGALWGIINGIVIAYFGVNSIVATLGTGTIMGGLVQMYTGGIPISGNISTALTNLSLSSVGGVPTLFVIMLVIALGVWYLQTQTTHGRRLASVGSNATAARLVGLDVRRVVFGSFVTAGVLAGVAGVLEVAWSGDGDPTIGGLTLIVPGLAAAFLGSTAFTPGRYNVPGTLLGMYFVAATVSGLALLGAQVWVQPVFDGAIVIIAVALSAYFRSRRTGEREVGA